MRLLAPLLWLALSVGLGPLAAPAGAAGLSDDGGAEWRVEQPEPPAPSPGIEGLKAPIGLGRIGDIEFYAPNRGALITAGNGSTVPPGVWFYNGKCEGESQTATCASGWRELATVCGATDGRIVWAGPDEFWTISDGRPGQAFANSSERPPLEDNTLCHFAPPPGDPTGKLEVLASYASPAFLSTSYLAMHAAACFPPEPPATESTNCWFAGEALESPEIGAFQLHWNGSSLEAEPYPAEGHAVRSMRSFEGKLYEGVRLLQQCGGEVTSNCDRVEKISRHPPALHVINGEGASRTFEGVGELPLYGDNEFFSALDYLHLSPGESSLWGAAGPELETPKGSAPAGVTVIHMQAGTESWSQVLGPETEPSGLEVFPEDVVNSIAAEPQTNDAWIALDSEADANHAEPSPDVPALLARVSANGIVSDELQLPSSGEPYGPKGAAQELVCPAAHDCWLVTTHGWLLHLSTQEEREHPELDTDPVFSSNEPIAIRPPDQGLPQVPSDAPPVDDSGLLEAPPSYGGAFAETKGTTIETKVQTALLSDLHSRLVHGSTLELRFHLAVRARVRLLAERRKKLVASTPMRTFQAGNRKLLLRLNPHDWPTRLSLQTHALAPLPTITAKEPVGGPEHGRGGSNTVSTGLAVLPHVPSFAEPGLLP